MKTMKIFKCMFSFLILVISLSCITTSYAADFYRCQIKSVIPRAESNGDVFIQVVPASDENRFTERSRVFIDGTSPGANKIMNVVLAGMLLNKTVTLLVDNPPTFNDVQVIQSAGLQAD